ncbi:MAG TPA: type II toxin-antitoxin system antitoxin SocA domain-containing protein [Candidatus Dormibacteraeota bacterium]|nr:type II toxin-antitoxin system antitoxin SocA domain-containing protein [Candidatus Dormibacteraeota bacterium]
MKEIVDHILYVADKDKTKLTQLQLHKISYFAFGYLLKIKKQNIAEKLYESESFEAWIYGPVLPKTYERFKKYVGTPILYRGKESDQLSEIDNFNKIIEILMHRNVFDLVERSHQHRFWASKKQGIRNNLRPTYSIEVLKEEFY